MLLKYTQAQKRIKASGVGKPQRIAGGMVKLTSGLMTVVPKIHRKVIKVASKRPAAIQRNSVVPAIKREQIPVDPCENSNDSGLGFDHHLDYHNSLATHPVLCFSEKETTWPSQESPEVKRRRLEIKLESDDANDNFTFQEAVRHQAPRTICVPVRARGRVGLPLPPLTLSSQLVSTSHNGLTQLLIVCQPEQQHRARYQTEGSRGAVKDRTGNGFPMVKLVGYDRPATLQVFIGTDQGRVAPHMFYQACRVSGKNSTPCVEKKVDGTIVIEVDIEPAKDMVVTCDCVGILKERNVDVEHRFPEEGSGRSKKKSTRCRMVFRTTITNPDGTQETLQVTSQPIVCTQPPGVPEICKKSLSSCSVLGGQELFILGKNFLKDTRVVFQEGDNANPSWSQSVQPDKEFLQQSHLVCVIPPYRSTDISEPVSVRLSVESSGKASEPHTFLYLPDNHPSVNSSVLAPDGNLVDSSVSAQGGRSGVFPPHLPVAPPLLMSSESTAPFLAPQTSSGKDEKVHPVPVMLWNKAPEVMMPPPPPGLLPINLRRSSVQMIVPEQIDPENLKQEIPDIPTTADLSSTQTPSMDTFHRFVSNNSLPAISVGSYLSNIEGNNLYDNKAQLMPEIPRLMIPPTTNVNKPMFSSDSSNLLTTVEPLIVSQHNSLQFDRRNASDSKTSPENMSVIVNSSVVQKKSLDQHITQESQPHKQVAEAQGVGLDILMMNKQSSSVTERLDAFVNSAAESHISPTPSSPIALTSVVNENSVNNLDVNGTNNMNKLQDGNGAPLMQPSPHTSPHQGSLNINEAPLCTLLSTTQQSSPAQKQTMDSIQASLEKHLSPSQAEMNLIHSPVQVSSNQAQTFSDLQSSLGQQMTSHNMTSTHISQSEINNMMQPPLQAPTSQVQTLSGLQVSLEQQLSPQTVNSSTINHSLDNLLQNSSQPSTNQNQEQVLQNLQVSLEQQLSSQTMSSSLVDHCNLNNLIQPQTQISGNEAQAMNNLQASLQTVNSTQMMHSESMQQATITLNDLNNAIQTSSHDSVSGVQSLPNIQASLGNHLSPQIITTQNNSESSASGNLDLSNMNPSVSTSSHIEAVVSQAQALSDLQATLEQQFSSQVMNSAQNVCSQSGLNPSLEVSTHVSVTQAQSINNLEMSFAHMTSQMLTSSQQSHESVDSSSISLNNSSPQAQVRENQSQVLSNLQASLTHHLSSDIISSESSQTMVQTSSPQSSNQTLSNLQSSIGHLSPEVLNAVQPNCSEPLVSNSLGESTTIDLTSSVSLINSQPINMTSKNTSKSNPVLLSSPTSRQSPTSILTSSGMTQTSMAIPNTQTMESNPPNISLSSSQSLLQNNPAHPNGMTQFDRMASQSLPMQVSGMSHFESMNKENERKEPPPYMMPSAGVICQPQASQQTMRREDGMPLPHELTQMSEHDLIRYINPSCFDAV